MFEKFIKNDFSEQDNDTRPLRLWRVQQQPSRARGVRNIHVERVKFSGWWGRRYV